MHWTIIERASVPGFFKFMFWPYQKSNEIAAEHKLAIFRIVPAVAAKQFRLASYKT